MTQPTINVAIALAQIFEGAAVANAQVRFELTGSDLDGSVLMLPKSAAVVVDTNGENTAKWWPNARGSQGTQTRVTVHDADGRLQFEGLAVFPAYDCTLTEALQLVASPSVTDAQRWALKARDWAISPDPVDGEASAKTSALAAAGSAAAAQAVVASAEFVAVHDALPTIAAVAADLPNIDTAVANLPAINDAPAQAQAAATSRAAADADAVATAADRVQTGIDRATADADAAASNGFMLTATAQAALAMTYAASAASVAQQDMSGVTAAALHRSPNAVVAMCLDDPRTWSDGGACLSKLDNLSWMQEPLNGAWLPGGFAAEMDARDTLGALGAASIVTGDSSTFTNGVGGWVGVNATLSSVNGRLRMTATAAFPIADLQITNTVAGQRYQLAITRATVPTGRSVFGQAGTAQGGATLYPNTNLGSAAGPTLFSFVATGATTWVRLSGPGSAVAGEVFEFDDFAVRPVSFATNPSGSYYQSNADGKFYRLWKNLFANSEGLAGTAASAANVTDAGATIAGFGNAIQFPAGATQSNLYRGIGSAGAAPLAAKSFVLSVYVQMGDASAPLVGTTNVSGDFAVQVNNNINAPATVALVSGSLYRVAVPFTHDGATVNIGVLRYAGQSGKAFQITGMQVEYGTAVSPYEPKVSDSSQSETFRGNVAKYGRTAWVAEASRVVGYAIDQPGRPMWKVLAVGGNGAPNINAAGASSWNLTSITAREAKLLVGTSAGGAVLLDLAADRRVRYTTTGSFLWGGGLGSANVGVPETQIGSSGLSNGVATAVAMTVLPDAPCDPVTGMQVPTIAVGTMGGVSIIQNTGAVVNSSTANVIGGIAITPRMLFANVTASATLLYVATPGAQGASFNLSSFSPGVAGLATLAWVGMQAQDRANVTRRNGARIDRLRLNEANPAASLLTTIADTYATGWTAGDIRRAYLADTVAGALGPVANLYTAGDNAGALTPLQNCTLAQSGPEIQITATAVGVCAADITVSLPVSGSTDYAYSAAARVGQAAGTAYIGGYGIVAGSVYYASGTTSQTAAAVRGLATTVSGETGIKLRIRFDSTAVGQTAYFSLLSLVRCVGDRSYKQIPLPIVGTLTRTAVAAAAQLMFYGGWSAANYTQEPYSADLEPGTGQWHATVFGSLPATLTPAMFPQGANVITNGTFDADANWIKGPGWSIAGGVATHTGTTQSNLEQDVLAVGTYYLITMNVSGGSVNVYAGPSSFASAQTGAVSLVLKAAAPQVFVQASQDGVTVDNVSYVPLGNAWAFDRSAAAGAYYRAGCNPGGFLVAELYDGTTTRTVTSPAAYNTVQPFKVSASYTTDGTLTLTVNGVPVQTATGAPLLTLNNAAAVLTIGNRRTLDAAWPGSLALLKLGATVPTADASTFMYAQEAAMFQPGAQITLPDSGAVVDMDYDATQDKWKVATAANESSFVGLVRTATAPVSAGSLAKVAHRSGIKLLARTGTNPGVDITIPATNALEAFNKRAEDAARLALAEQAFDYTGAFTATTAVNSTALTNVAGLSVPATATIIGAAITGAGIPANTTVTGVNGTTVYMSAPATAAASGVVVSFTDLILPVGYEAAPNVFAAGALKYEGAANDYTRLYDGFRERVRFAAAPGNVRARIGARRMAP